MPMKILSVIAPTYFFIGKIAQLSAYLGGQRGDGKILPSADNIATLNHRFFRRLQSNIGDIEEVGEKI